MAQSKAQSQVKRQRKPRMLGVNTPLEALMPSWLRSLRAENKPATTQKTYRIGVERFLTYLHREGLSTGAGEIERQHVHGFVAKLIELEYAPTTARLWLTAVQVFCAWLVEEGEIASSPAAHVSPPKLPERLTRTLSEDEARQLIHACAGAQFTARRDEALMRLMLDTGLREAELASIRLDQINLDEGLLRIIGKGDHERVVAFGPKTARAIDRYLRVRSAHRSADLPWLWLGHAGRFGVKGIYKQVVERAKQAKLGHVRPHVLRHTWANLCLKNGMQQHDLKHLGGWRSDAMLWRYGAQLRGDRALAAHKLFGPGDRL